MVVNGKDVAEDKKTEREQINLNAKEENEGRLKNMFEKFTIQKARYDDDCIDLCIPYAEVITNAEYYKLVKDDDKVSQLASILVRYNRMSTKVLEELCFVLKKIDAYDFTRLRDDKVDVRQLRNRILGIPDNFIVTMEEIDARVA